MTTKRLTSAELEEIRLKIDEKMDSLGKKIVASGLDKIKRSEPVLEH